MDADRPFVSEQSSTEKILVWVILGLEFRYIFKYHL